MCLVSERRRTPGNQASLREANRTRILDAVKLHGALTQVELAGATGLSPATVSNIVKELSTSGVLHTAPSTRSGRRAQRVTLAHGLGLVAGVDVSHRHMRVSLADFAATIVADHRVPLARDHRADNELDKATMLIVDMVESLDSSLDELAGIGVVVAAPVDERTGRVARRGIMRGWQDVDIAATMRERLGRPVVVENSANAAALAELRYGAARGKRDVLVLEIGDGVGAGIIADGRLVRGHRGVAGEFGHVPLVPDGPPCRCGRIGCLEAVAGARAVLDGLDGVTGTLTLTDLIVGAMAGNAEYLRAIADAGRTIGRATGALCTLLDPERIVVGGDFARAGELLLGPMRHALESTVLVEADGTPDLVQSQLDGSAAVLGAVGLAVDEAGIPRSTPSA